MNYFYLEPEVAGGLGEHTVVDVSVHPPIVTYLHYSFDGWPDDVILTTFSCYIVAVPARHALEGIKVSGIKFDYAETSPSEFFKDMYPGRQLPTFVWLKVYGRPGRDDFGIAPDHRLVVSERVLDLLKRLGLSYATMEPFGVTKENP
jgi:hypothetical protein